MASRSLGTLTVNLVAEVAGFVQGMSKADRAAEKWRKQVEKDLKTVAQVSGAAIGAAAAATAALVVSQVKAATELRQQAQLSAATTQEFQRYAIAADTVGIGQEKLSDQLKDFNEKAGEFQRSGGGGMKDFFEQIAPQIGITADAFRDLSGPQALQLYYDSLEKAGLSQQQMSFYLESMASDTTALIPLLRNGGEGFKMLGDMAEQAGAIMSEDTVTAAEKLSAVMWVSQQSMAGFRNQIGEELLPTLADLAVQFSDVATETAIADDVANTLNGTIKGLAAVAVGAYASLQLLGRGIAGVALAGGTLTKDAAWYERIIPPLLARRVYKNWDEAKAALSIVGDDLDETAQRYATLLNGIWSAGEGEGGNQNSENRIAQIAEFMKQMREEAAKSGPGLATFNDEASKTADAIAKEITALERAAETYGYTAAQIGLYKLETMGATEAQLLAAAAAYDVIEALEAEKKAAEDAGKKRADALTLINDLLPEQEQKTRLLAEQQKFLNEALLDYPELAEDIALALSSVADEIEKVGEKTDEMSVFAEQAARNMQDSFADFLFDPFDEGLDGLADNFLKTLQRMAADAAAAAIFDSLGFGTGKSSGGGSGGGGVNWASIAGWFGGFFADGGRPAANKISIVGERGPELFIPDGVTGSVIANDKIDMAAMRQDRTPPTQVHIGNMNFPGVTNARQAEQSAGAAGRRINAAIAAAQRFS